MPVGNASIEMTVREEGSRKPPQWTEDHERAEIIWHTYNLYLSGKRMHQIAQELDLHPQTVSRYIQQAREELPYVTASMTYELVERRQVWLREAETAMRELMDSPLRIDRKVDSLSKLMQHANGWFTAIEELVGARKSSGQRVNMTVHGDGQKIVMFDLEKMAAMVGAAEEEARLDNQAIIDSEGRDV